MHNIKQDIGSCITHEATAFQGYGVQKIDGKLVRLHRKAYCDAHGIQLDEIRGRIVMHTCDNRACINPDHLVLGSHADNQADKVQKNRQAKGESIWNSKLTTSQVQEIRRLQAIGVTTSKAAEMFCVSSMCISRIFRRVTWKHV